MQRELHGRTADEGSGFEPFEQDHLQTGGDLLKQLQETTHDGIAERGGLMELETAVIEEPNPRIKRWRLISGIPYGSPDDGPPLDCGPCARSPGSPADLKPDTSGIALAGQDQQSVPAVLVTLISRYNIRAQQNKLIREALELPPVPAHLKILRFSPIGYSKQPKEKEQSYHQYRRTREHDIGKEAPGFMQANSAGMRRLHELRIDLKQQVA